MIKEKKEQDEILCHLPNPKRIACLRCKWGVMNYLGITCAKYPDMKPTEVYYENANCEKFEEIK